MTHQVLINLPLRHDEVPKLRETIGWGGRQQDYPALIERCNFYGGIRNKNGELIAFGYICGMGLEHGYLEDVIIHPDYQGKGLGKLLVLRLLEHSKEFGLEIITVSFEATKKHFYEKCGFTTSLSGVLYVEK